MENLRKACKKQGFYFSDYVIQQLITDMKKRNTNEKYAYMVAGALAVLIGYALADILLGL